MVHGLNWFSRVSSNFSIVTNAHINAHTDSCSVNKELLSKKVNLSPKVGGPDIKSRYGSLRFAVVRKKTLVCIGREFLLLNTIKFNKIKKLRDKNGLGMVTMRMCACAWVRALERIVVRCFARFKLEQFLLPRLVCYFC